MQNKVYRIAGAVLFLALTSCSFSKDSKEVPAEEVKTLIDENVRQAEENRLAAISRADVKVSFVGLDFPNNYSMVIEWPAEVPLVDVFIDDQLVAADVRGGRKDFHQVLPRPHTIKVLSKNSFKHVVSTVEAGEFTPPTDFAFTGTLELNSNETIKAARIFMMEHAELILNGFNLHLETEELIVRDALITTFSENDRDPSQNETRLDNSTIVVQARKIRGTMRFDLSGLPGSPGITPVLTPEVVLANKGQDGQAGQAAYSADPCRPIATEERIPGCETHLSAAARFCYRPATNGTNGSPGAQGLRGGNGGRGGNSAALSISSEDFSEARIFVRGRPGPGGRGAPGTPGFPGGAGGAAGATDEWGNCAKAGHVPRDGSPGAQGPEGEPGQNGPVGNRGPLILPTAGNAQEVFVVDPWL